MYEPNVLRKIITKKYIYKYYTKLVNTYTYLKCTHLNANISIYILLIVFNAKLFYNTLRF